MTEPPGRGELPFVGADRIALVDELLARFDEVARNHTPHWVSLEAATGWGKSRIGHELYRQLAAGRQDNGAYWPSSIAQAVNEGELSSMTADARRKRIYPEVLHPAPGSTPAWFWWGIGCDHRYGTPLQALANDVSQFEAAKSGLEARWRSQASRSTQLRRAISGERGREAVEIGAGEALTAGLAAANMAVPGLGFLVLAGKWGMRSLRKRAPGETAGPVLDVSAAQGVDLVQEIAPGVGQVARDVVPVVIFVEDFHRSDDSLVELLARLLSAGDTGVLIVTTAWPGSVDEPERPCHRLVDRVPIERRSRYTTGSGGEAALCDFEPADVRRLVEQLIPNGSPELLDALVERYSNPLALQLACDSSKLRAALAGGHDAVGVVRGLPREVRRLYEEAWEQLPGPVRSMCMLAALSTPAGVSATEGRGDDRWDDELLTAGAQALPWLDDEMEALDTSLGAVGGSYAWVRVVTEWLRRFHDPIQFDIAQREALDHFDAPVSDLAAFFEAVVARTRLDHPDSDRALHHARLVVALEAEGFVAASDTWRASVDLLCDWLASQPDTASSRQLLALAERAIRLSPERTEAQLTLRALSACALGRLGRMTQATAALEQLLVDQTQVLGPDSLDTLATRNNLASWMGEEGRVEDAVQQLEQLLDDETRVSGPDAASTMTTRNNLAAMLGRAGRVEAAIRQLEALSADQTRVLGAEAFDTLRTVTNLAFWLGEAGRVEEAIHRFEALLADQVRALGADASLTMTSRSYHAFALGRVGRVEEAIHRLEALLADQTRVLGPDAAGTLGTRNDLALMLGRAGRVAEAIAALESLLADQTPVLGPDSPDTLTTRANLGTLLGEAGRVAEAIAALEVLLTDQTRVLGADAPATLRARNNLADMLGRSGRVGEAVAHLEALLPDKIRVLGADAPNTLITRNNLASMLGRSGRAQEAVHHFEQLVADWTRVLGPHAPDTLRTRNDLAHWLGKAGLVKEAVIALELLLADQTRVLGLNAPDTLTTRNNLAALLAKMGRLEEAIHQFETLFMDQARVLGSDAVATLTTRDNLAYVLEEARRPKR
jgi:tetratricopeptide (TPR) repeat protein